MSNTAAFRSALHLRLTDAGHAPQQVRELLETAIDCLPPEWTHVAKLGEEWVPTHMHSSGRLYRVICKGLEVSKDIGVESVIYEDYHGRIFVQPTSRFYGPETGKADHQRHPRFKPLEQLVPSELNWAWEQTRKLAPTAPPVVSGWPKDLEPEVVLHNLQEQPGPKLALAQGEEPTGMIQLFTGNRFRFTASDGSLSIDLVALPKDDVSLSEVMARFTRLIKLATES